MECRASPSVIARTVARGHRPVVQASKFLLPRWPEALADDPEGAVCSFTSVQQGLTFFVAAGETCQRLVARRTNLAVSAEWAGPTRLVSFIRGRRSGLLNIEAGVFPSFTKEKRRENAVPS